MQLDEEFRRPAVHGRGFPNYYMNFYGQGEKPVHRIGKRLICLWGAFKHNNCLNDN